MGRPPRKKTTKINAVQEMSFSLYYSSKRRRRRRRRKWVKVAWPVVVTFIFLVASFDSPPKTDTVTRWRGSRNPSPTHQASAGPVLKGSDRWAMPRALLDSSPTYYSCAFLASALFPICSTCVSTGMKRRRKEGGGAPHLFFFFFSRMEVRPLYSSTTVHTCVSRWCHTHARPRRSRTDVVSVPSNDA